MYLLMSELLVASGGKNRVDLVLTYSHVGFFGAQRSDFASKQGLRVYLKLKYSQKQVMDNIMVLL